MKNFFHRELSKAKWQSPSGIDAILSALPTIALPINPDPKRASILRAQTGQVNPYPDSMSAYMNKYILNSDLGANESYWFNTENKTPCEAAEDMSVVEQLEYLKKIDPNASMVVPPTLNWIKKVSRGGGKTEKMKQIRDERTFAQEYYADFSPELTTRQEAAKTDFQRVRERIDSKNSRNWYRGIHHGSYSYRNPQVYERASEMPPLISDQIAYDLKNPAMSAIVFHPADNIDPVVMLFDAGRLCGNFVIQSAKPKIPAPKAQQDLSWTVDPAPVMFDLDIPQKPESPSKTTGIGFRWEISTTSMEEEKEDGKWAWRKVLWDS